MSQRFYPLRAADGTEIFLEVCGRTKPSIHDTKPRCGSRQRRNDQQPGGYDDGSRFGNRWSADARGVATTV
jgi:hypothetical protein